MAKNEPLGGWSVLRLLSSIALSPDQPCGFYLSAVRLSSEKLDKIKSGGFYRAYCGFLLKKIFGRRRAFFLTQKPPSSIRESP